MNSRHLDNRATGLTRLEVIVIIGCLAILFLGFLLLMPSLPDERGRSPRVRCASNLRQFALSLILWGYEREGKLPMEVSVAEGGSREHAVAGNLMSTLAVATNEIYDPRILLCPSDRRRRPVTNFANITTANMSYFLNIDAQYSNQTQVLAGDRNVAVNGRAIPPGPLMIRDPNAISWSSNLHVIGGNVALADGSVHQVWNRQFQILLWTNGTGSRLIIP